MSIKGQWLPDEVYIVVTQPEQYIAYDSYSIGQK